ncbi:MAG: hypothetical protein D6696_16075, partial [Acidobacteria bacterium]
MSKTRQRRRALYLVLAALLVACSSSSRRQTLSIFFDGVPDAETAAGIRRERRASREAVRRARQPAPPAVEAPAGAPAEAPKPPPEPAPPLENAAGWPEVLALLPADATGAADWMQAVRDELMKPRLLLPEGVPSGPPFTLDTLLVAGLTEPEQPLLDFEVVMEEPEAPLYEVRFPHSTHSFWLACSSCHPGAGTMRTPEMNEILAGRSCGACHGRVAFNPEVSCSRCHPGLTPPARETLEEELARARREPPPRSPELSRRGAELYRRYCAVCHGDAGDGRGRLAPWLDPKPRDFTSGVYKFTSVYNGAPTDFDVFRTISRGVPGTSMPAWSALPYEDRWALTYFVESFSTIFEQPRTPIEIPEPPARTEQLLAQGAQLFRDSGCNTCHGDAGRGDGLSAPTLVDNWGHKILPFNFASGRPFKSGDGPATVFRVAMTGIPGTPMPGFAEALTPDQVWSIALYVDSLRGTAREPFAVRGDIHFIRGGGAENSDGPRQPEPVAAPQPAAEQPEAETDDFWGVPTEEGAPEGEVDDFWGVPTEE